MGIWSLLFPAVFTSAFLQGSRPVSGGQAVMVLRAMGVPGFVCSMDSPFSLVAFVKCVHHTWPVTLLLLQRLMFPFPVSLCLSPFRA